ncbi:unnamed protein product, partial [Polarella glacialis]
MDSRFTSSTVAAPGLLVLCSQPLEPRRSLLFCSDGAQTKGGAMAEPGHKPEADLRSSPPPWNATAVAPDAFDALLTQLASVHRVELGRASEEAKRLSKEIEELSNENRTLKKSVAAGSSSVMETNKVPADNNNHNNSPMEQQAAEQDAISTERGEQDKKIDEMMLEIDFNTQPERQEKGHDGQTGKVPADTSPMEQQSGEQEAGEQDDGQIKEDEQEVPAGQEDEPECADQRQQEQCLPSKFADLPNRILPLRSDLSFGFIGVKPTGPSSHVAESPFFALPGVNFNCPILSDSEKRSKPSKPKYNFHKANSMSMLEHARRQPFEVKTSTFEVGNSHPSAPSDNYLTRRKSYTDNRRKSYTSLRSPSPGSPRDAPGTPKGPKSFSRASSRLFLEKASSRLDLGASDGEGSRELTGLHPVWKFHSSMVGTSQLQSPQRAGSLHLRTSEKQYQQSVHSLWGHQAWEVLGLLMISWDLFAVPMQVFAPFPEELIVSTTILTTLYWTCDVPFTFMPSKHADGTRHISLKAMARQCASSWLLFDSIMVLVNWLVVVLTIFVAAERSDKALSHIGGQEMLKFVSGFRVLRVPRFIFKSKAGFLALLEEYGGSKRIRIISGIAGMLVFIVLTNHLIACAFYGIATISSLETNWTYYAFDLTGRTSWLYRYTTSYHWAMGLFHTSGSDILPTNSAERIFVQFVLIWNLA